MDALVQEDEEVQKAEGKLDVELALRLLAAVPVEDLRLVVDAGPAHARARHVPAPLSHVACMWASRTDARCMPSAAPK